MKYKLLIFDLDGTTLNTLTDLTNSVNHILGEHNLPTRTESEIKSFLGNGIHSLIELSAPKNSPPDTIETLYNEFLPYYKEHSLDTTKPYDKITDLLKALKAKGYLLGLVSNKADIVVKDLITRFFDGIFDYSIGQTDGINRKPAPDMVDLLLNKLNLNSRDALYIGDSEVDYMTAKNAGMDIMSVSYGFRDKKFLESLKPDYIVDSVKDMSDILLK